MRVVRFCAAMSPDGYMPDPRASTIWIVPDPDVDFAAMQAPFDTFLIGRKTFEMMRRAGRDADARNSIRCVLANLVCR